VPIWNTGDAPLHIEGLEGGCGCASVSISEKTILPGEKAVLHVGALLRSEASPLVFWVRIKSDDPESPTHYMVEAHVEAVARTEPSQVYFGDTPVGEEVSQKLRVYRPSDAQWLATDKLSVESKLGLFRPEVAPPDGDAAASSEKVVVIRLRSDLSPGPFRDWLVLRPSYTERFAEIPVQGHIVPPVLVSPSVLHLGATKLESNVLDSAQ
jgi:hypothetical protein